MQLFTRNIPYYHPLKYFLFLLKHPVYTLIRYSMEQNPSWVANTSSARHDIPRMLWIPKVHYRVYKNTPSFLILSQISPVKPFQPISSRPFSILSSHLCPSLPSGFFPRIFPTKTLYTPLLSPIRTTRPLVSSFFWLPEKYLVKITDYEAPHYSVFQSPLLPRPCIYEIVIISRQVRVWFSCIYTGSSSVFERVPSAGWCELSHYCNVTRVKVREERGEMYKRMEEVKVWVALNSTVLSCGIFLYI